MIALDKEFEALESKATVFQAEEMHLEPEANPLKREIERLKHQVQEGASSDPDEPGWRQD